VLGHFALRDALLLSGLLSESARVVIVTGDIYICSDPPECTSDYRGSAMQSYARSCLGRCWIAAELQRRTPTLHVVIVHPGVFSSNLFQNRGSNCNKDLSQIMGSQTSLFAATQPVERGAYLHNTQGLMKLSTEDPAMDRDKARALWELCTCLSEEFVSGAVA
jgi:hypothetical protein